MAKNKKDTYVLFCMFLPRALYRSHTSSVYEKEWALLKAERQCFDREVEAFRRTGGQLAGHYVGFGDAFTAAKEPRKEKQVLDSVANAGAHKFATSPRKSVAARTKTLPRFSEICYHCGVLLQMIHGVEFAVLSPPSSRRRLRRVDTASAYDR
eukprot:GEMP01114927.1.p1 GENE.GEMP01114927.1~~GEMP01114927.1.p1  ORF type:complete len:153 (+),score=28.24 GEMP01114927.1:66-524(+)